MSDAVWTDDMIAALRAAWDRDDKTSAIARALGVSKNAVVGKARRLDLPRRESPIRRAPPGDTPPARAERSAALAIEGAPPSIARGASKPRAVVVRVTAPKADPPPKVERPPPEGCRWPMWGFRDAATHVYCGAARPDAALSYCAEHQAKAFVPIRRLVAA